jgi:hypothetical protein
LKYKLRPFDYSDTFDSKLYNRSFTGFNSVSKQGEMGKLQLPWIIKAVFRVEDGFLLYRRVL